MTHHMTQSVLLVAVSLIPEGPLVKHRVHKHRKRVEVDSVVHADFFKLYRIVLKEPPSEPFCRAAGIDLISIRWLCYGYHSASSVLYS